MKDKVFLPDNIKTAMDMLLKNGFEAYAVGGCVRDFFAGREVYDYDITTNALPEETKSVFAGFKVIDTGIKHGTVTVVVNSTHIEITTYRTDGEYTDLRHPANVRFSQNIHDDLSRRDFCINAMAYSPRYGLVDDFGGIDDLKNKIIRCVGDPDKRFGEDALRMMRALRFASNMGFSIDLDTEISIHKNIGLLQSISVERVYSEFKRLLVGDGVCNVLLKFRDAAETVFPCISDYSDIEYHMVCRMMEHSSADCITRLEVLFFCSDSETARKSLLNLNSDKASVRRISDCINALGKIPGNNIRSTCMEIYRLGFECVHDAAEVNLAWAYECGDLNRVSFFENKLRQIRQIKNEDICHSISQLAVNGSDLINANIAYGSQIGDILDFLTTEVICSRVANNKSDLLIYAAKFGGDSK